MILYEAVLRRPKLVTSADENTFARGRIGRIMAMVGMGNRSRGVVRGMKTGCIHLYCIKCKLSFWWQDHVHVATDLPMEIIH